ncbi:MAG: ROK family transcriptional regulator [Bacteroidetes bacterium]|nr:ROK family transcriptional regulator [Bacteroidota bacterium]MBS1975532.1 ROK family transcriptional regulator [Bacteroidota bacterium]
MRYSVFTHSQSAVLSGVAFKNQSRKKKVISQLTAKGEATIPELAEFLNISIPKTTALMASLLEEGLAIDTGRKTDGLGRKAAIYSLNPESCYFLGVEIRKYKINIGLMSFNAGIARSSLNIPFDFTDAGDSLNAVIKEIKKFLCESPIPKEKIIGVGLSLAGRINVKTNQILSIYHFGDAPVKEKLEEELGLPVFLDNDSRAIAYGEYHFGNYGLPYTQKNVCIANLDYGMALGIFVEGKPVYGVSGYAGEIGHIPMFNNEKICFCGKKGCLETEASGLAMIDYINKKIVEGSSSSLQKVIAKKGFIELEDIIDAVKHGDNLAIEAVSEIAHNLGKGLAVAINMLNPELIVLGGMLAVLGDPLLLPVKSSIIHYSLSMVNADTKISLSSIDQKAGLPGCCLLVRDKILGLV